MLIYSHGVKDDPKKRKEVQIMTNEKIILGESLKLMESGFLAGSGKRAIVEINGVQREIELPEPIHTFNAWKQMGYKVKKGEHAIAKFSIWKYTEKAKKEEEKTGNALEDAPKSNMFMKMSAFFSSAQVERI